ncbi:MAG: hypothetical protein GY751_12875, partial [Bacteroidetes bacterium]|nr:hypothetical protein [Bacteroidota bacterium]
IVPTIISVTPPLDATYTVGQKIDIEVTMSEIVIVSGTPRILVYLDSGAVYATYYSGSFSDTLIFRYSVEAGTIDSSGIEIAPSINLNSGTIRNIDSNNIEILSFPDISTPAVLIDGSGPGIIDVSAPSNGSYKIGDFVDFTVTTFEDVNVTGTPRLQINIETGVVYANYLSGSGSSILTFRYIVVDGNEDLDGIVVSPRLFLNGGTIQDVDQAQDGSWDFTAPDTDSIFITGNDAFVSSVSPPFDDLHREGTNLDFITTFNYPVSVSGTPRLSISIGTNTKYATYYSGSGTTTITFRYITENSDLDFDGLTITSAIELNGGSVTGPNSRSAILDLGAIDLSAILLAPSEFQLWLDADDATTVTESGGDVSQWADKSGEGNDAFQMTALNQPSIVAAQINGRSVMRLNGTSTFFYLPDFLSGNTEGEIFIVLKTASDPAPSNYQTGLWYFSDIAVVVYNYNGVNIYDHFGSTTRPQCTHGDPVDFSTPHVYNVTSNSTDWTGRINGTQVCYRGSNVVDFTSGPYIGRSSASYYFQGDFAEILIFSKTLQSSERQHVEDYLQNKWNL